MKSLHILFAFLVFIAASRADVKPPLVLLPKNIAANELLPVAVWLHGYGANPSIIMDEPTYQAVADRLHIAIVGVYATNKIDDESYEWSVLPPFDYSQVMESLANAERTRRVRFSGKMLFGFSQGGCVAAELSSRYPKVFLGAIVLSPGARSLPGALPVLEGNAKQLYYLSCGAGEAAKNIEFTRSYSGYLSKTGAKVHSREVQGMKTHARPPDWPERFPEWVAAILSIKL
jgi:predicted esterase